MTAAPVWARRMVAGAGALVFVAYAGAVGYLKVNETALVYHPREAAFEGGRINPPPAALQVELVRFAASDGAQLAAWLIPPPGGDTTAFWVLVCHGNAGNITLTKRQDFYARLRALGVGILAFDYRGFGASDERAPTEAGLYLDAQAAYGFLRATRGIPADRIVIFGHSLGSGVAVDLAARDSAAGLVLEGAYTSVPEAGQRRFPIMPVRLIASNRFASIDKISRVAMPKLLLHARDDGVIPFDLGERLFNRAGEPKRFQELTGGHEDAFRLDPRYFEAFGMFLRSLRHVQVPTTTSKSRVGG